jgi:hypothetical protein
MTHARTSIAFSVEKYSSVDSCFFLQKSKFINEYIVSNFEVVRSEVTSFWNEEGLSFSEKMEEAATEQLSLPEDIMPAFHDLMKDREDQGAGKK